MSLYDCMNLRKSTQDIILESINDYLDGKINNLDIIINESTSDIGVNKYIPLIESAKVVKELEELENDQSKLISINDDDDKNKESFLKKIETKIQNVYKWFLSQDPEDKHSVLRTFLRIIVSIVMKIILIIITKKITSTTNLKIANKITNGKEIKEIPIFKRLGLKIAQSSINIAVASIIDTVYSYGQKLTLMPLEAKVNIDKITNDNLKTLKNQRDFYFDKVFTKNEKDDKGKAEYMALLLTYDRSIQKLEKIRKYLNTEDKIAKNKTLKKIEKIKKDRGDIND